MPPHDSPLQKGNAMNICQFECTRGSLTIRGTEIRPAGEALPIAIVSHGFLSNSSSVRHYALALAEMGYAAYLFDFCGGGLGGKSDGKTEQMSVLTEVEDLLAVVAYAKSRPYTNSESVVLMGCSQGGFVSALAAASLGDAVEKLILLYPALCIPDDARRGRMMFAKFDPNNIPDTFRCGPMKLGRCYPADVMDMDPIREISGYHGPVLILHGAKDRIVALEYSLQAKAAYGEACRLVTLENEDHGFSKKGDAVAIDTIRRFLTGWELILAVDVKVTGHSLKFLKNGNSLLTLPFEGRAESRYFRGVIQPGAADAQERRGMKTVRFCADYRICGKDHTGQDCWIRVVNENTGKGWKPTVTTNSAALDFINHSIHEACLEERKQGPVVRIYCKKYGGNYAKGKL